MSRIAEPECRVRHALSGFHACGAPMTTELASDPIIVYGAPRSGTTYLQRLLSSHPDVYISDETEDLLGFMRL